MDRETLVRTLVASGLILALLMGYQYFAQRDRTVRPAEAPRPSAPDNEAREGDEGPGPAIAREDSDRAEEPSPEVPAEDTSDTPPEAAPPKEPAAPTEAAGPRPPALVAVGADEAAECWTVGSDLAESPYDLQAEIDPRGAVVRCLTLARHRFFKTVRDRHEPADQRAPMALLEPGAPCGAFAVTELRVWVGEASEPSRLDLSKVLWRVVRDECDGEQAVLEVDVVPEGGVERLLTVRRVYRVRRPMAREAGSESEPAPMYEMTMRLEFVGAVPSVEKVAYVLRGPSTLPREGIGYDFRAVVFGHWQEGQVRVETLPGAKLKKQTAEEAMSLGGTEVAWIGQVDKYFAVVAVPQKPSPDGTFAAGAEAFASKVEENGGEVPLAQVRLLVKETPLEAGSAVGHDYLIFAGPKEPDLLQAHYANLGLPGLIIWSRCCVELPGISEISRFLLVVLEVFYAVTRNYGLAIILLVLVLRVALHPVTRWSHRSMSKMQKMGPKMGELREQFGDDKQRLNEEMMRLYREEGINPATGCLPMFLQMPIWIGLYGALMAAIQLRHAAFLPAWMVPAGSAFLQDLAHPDALVIFDHPHPVPGQDMPLIGFVAGALQNMMGGPIMSFNILPLLMGVTMFLQQRFTPQASTGPQAEQQKKMMVFMTIFFAIILYNRPSGLSLYIFTSTLLGFLESRYLKKKFAADQEAAEVVPAGVAKASGPMKKKPFGAGTGRHKSPAERLEAWVQKRLGGKGKGRK